MVLLSSLMAKWSCRRRSPYQLTASTVELSEIKGETICRFLLYCYSVMKLIPWRFVYMKKYTVAQFQKLWLWSFGTGYPRQWLHMTVIGAQRFHFRAVYLWVIDIIMIYVLSLKSVNGFNTVKPVLFFIFLCLALIIIIF